MYPDAFAIFSIRDHCSNLHRRIQGKLRSQLVSAYCPFLVTLQCHACFYLGVGGHIVGHNDLSVRLFAIYK